MLLKRILIYQKLVTYIFHEFLVSLEFSRGTRMNSDKYVLLHTTQKYNCSVKANLCSDMPIVLR